MFIIIISLLAAGARAAAGAVYFANPIGEDFPVRDPSRKLSAVAAECDTLAKYWVSAPYEAERIGKDGETTTLANLSATLTITSQSGCAFEGINEWTNGALGGKETVAGIIDSETEITMLELGVPPAGGSTARIDATLANGLMRWRYTGLGAAADDRWVTVFDADFAPDAAPAVAEKDCLDISGTWKSDATYYYRVYEDGPYDFLGDPRVEKVGPLYNTLTLEMVSDASSGCLVKGTNSWDNGAANGTEVVAGVVHAGTRAATLVEVGGMYVNGRMEINFDCSLDCDTMQMHFIGKGKDYGVNFDSYLGKDGGPIAKPLPDVCDSFFAEEGSDLVGTYSSSQDDIFFVPSPPPPGQLVGMSMEIGGRDGCAFWGAGVAPITWAADLQKAEALPFLGVIHGNLLETASILQIGPMCPDKGGACVDTSAVIDVGLVWNTWVKSTPGHESEGGYVGALDWHYVATSDDGKNGAVLDTVYRKDHFPTAAPTTAAPTPTPGSDGAAGRSAGLIVTLAAAAAALL